MRLRILDATPPTASRLDRLTANIPRSAMNDLQKLLLFRAGIFGVPWAALIHEVLRGSSAWTEGERELFAAYVAHVNRCRFCVDIHAEMASSVLGEPSVEAVLHDPRNAPVRAQVRAALPFLEKMTSDADALGPDDAADVRRAGVSDEALRDAIDAATIANVMVRLAQAFDMSEWRAGDLDTLLRAVERFGYRVPAALRPPDGAASGDPDPAPGSERRPHA